MTDRVRMLVSAEILGRTFRTFFFAASRSSRKIPDKIKNTPFFKNQLHHIFPTNDQKKIKHKNSSQSHCSAKGFPAKTDKLAYIEPIESGGITPFPNHRHRVVGIVRFTSRRGGGWRSPGPTPSPPASHRAGSPANPAAKLPSAPSAGWLEMKSSWVHKFQGGIIRVTPDEKNWYAMPDWKPRPK